MERFRECEKETKTKAFSKEGLRQQSKQNPEDVRNYASGMIVRKNEKKCDLPYKSV